MAKKSRKRIVNRSRIRHSEKSKGEGAEKRGSVGRRVHVAECEDREVIMRRESRGVTRSGPRREEEK